MGNPDHIMVEKSLFVKGKGHITVIAALPAVKAGTHLHLVGSPRFKWRVYDVEHGGIASDVGIILQPNSVVPSEGSFLARDDQLTGVVKSKTSLMRYNCGCIGLPPRAAGDSLILSVCGDVTRLAAEYRVLTGEAFGPVTKEQEDELLDNLEKAIGDGDRLRRIKDLLS